MKNLCQRETTGPWYERGMNLSAPPHRGSLRNERAILPKARDGATADRPRAGRGPLTARP